MLSSSPRGTPIRRQSSAIEHIPFSTNISHLSAELGRTDSAASSPCRSEVSFGGHSFRDQEQQKKSLEEENFKLKLRVYMLEERLQRQDSSGGSNKALAELKVQSAALREELIQKSALLRRASETLEALEQRHAEQQARLQQDQAERALLEDTLEELEAQYRAELEEHGAGRRRLEEALLALRTEQRQSAAALADLRRSHAEELARRERAERERSRLQDELRSLQRRHGEESRRRERLAEENGRLQETVGDLRSTAASPAPGTGQAFRPRPAACDGSCCGPAGSEPAPALLAAVSGERRREQAVAAAALQLQTERARSLQTTVQTLSEQVRHAQAELAQCRTERDHLLRLHSPQRESSVPEALSSTEGVEVIPETCGREDPLHSCESPGPGPDLAAWLGSMPRLRSDSPEEAAAAAGPAAGSAPASAPAHEPAVEEMVSPAAYRVGPAADNSDWETWSEPDRSVSQARIGLERSSLEPPGQPTTDTDTGPGRRRQRHLSAEVRDLEGRIDGLRHVRDGLWAEVAICQKLATPTGAGAGQQGVVVPADLLEDVQQLHRRLEEAAAASGRLCHQREAGQRPAPPPPELTLALTITQEELAESSQKLAAAQQRIQRLRARLQRTEQDRAQLERERDASAQQLSRLTERLERTEAENGQLVEAARRRSEQQESGALRQLRRQLERSAQRQQELEQLVRRLTDELRQLPSAGGEAAAAEERVWRAEQQLLTLGRQRLRLQSEITRLRSRARLLHSQERVRDSQLAEEEADGQTGRQPRQPRAGPAGDGRAVRQLAQQLQRARAQIQRMHATAREYDGAWSLHRGHGEFFASGDGRSPLEAGQSCAESVRSCELPAAPGSSAGGPRLSSHSESDPLEPLRTSCGQPAYSSPDLGIESDCQRCSSPTSSTTVQSERSAVADRTPRPSGNEEAAKATAAEFSTLALLRQTLHRPGRADRDRAAVHTAIYRGLEQTQLLVSRVRGGARRPAAAAAGSPCPPGR